LARGKSEEEAKVSERVMSSVDNLAGLIRKMEESRPLLDKFDSYVNGTQPLAFLAPEVAAATQGRLKPLNVGWPRLVVQAVEERLDVSGFRIPGSETPDPALWDIWQDNNLDEESQLLHLDSLVYGCGYALVWSDGRGVPRITVESPREVFVERYPGSRRVRYALKRWVEEQRGHAVLFTETAVFRFRTEAKMENPAFLDGFTSDWKLSKSYPNPLGMVPLVPFPNRPRTGKPGGESELSDLLPIFDALNKLSTDMMVSSEFNASPRRWATGIELPEEEDENGNPTGKVDTSKAFAQEAGRVWLAEPVDARLGQFQGASLDGFVNALATLTQSLGALSGLPPHYLGLHGDQPASADAIRSAEASLVAKVRRKHRPLSGGWETVMRLAVAIRDGRYDPALNRLETVWADPETRTVAQGADAALKLVQGGLLTADAALEHYVGMTPGQIENNRNLRRRAALDSAAVQVFGNEAS
jgi:hypothetical protein